VADLDRPSLAPGDRHHLERVLRLGAGEVVTVSDGRGGWRACRFGTEAELSPAGEVVRDPRPSPPVEVAFALVKGERPELVVQKLTELGADRIVPFAAARSVVRWDASRAARHVERLRRVAREAAGQCRRTWLPEVDEVATFADVAGRAGAVLADQEGSPPWLPDGPVLVGPEGGWSDEELARDLPRIALGPHVLRAETAALAVGALLAALRAGLVASPG
jgi:16S rRNA (uracil1498-N3)-methyltransferase